MLQNNFTGDKIQQMIKKKIKFTNGTQFNNYSTYNSIHYRTKSSHKAVKPLQKKPKNDIVIMNMPPANRLEFFDHQFQPHTQKNQVKHQNRTPFFTNPHISLGLKRFPSFALHSNNLNKQNVYNTNPAGIQQLRRYNSVNIRFSTGNVMDKTTLNQKISLTRSKGLENYNSIHNLKAPVSLIEFKPSFKQLLKRNSKIHSKIQTKLKKSQLNYQRAITTSSVSRKKTFQKILSVFQENFLNKPQPNPQIIVQRPLEETKLLIERQSVSRQLQSRSKTSRKSRQQVKKDIPKQDEPCRPWSAGKKNVIKLQSTEDQNPLQFYSINAKY